MWLHFDWNYIKIKQKSTQKLITKVITNNKNNKNNKKILKWALPLLQELGGAV